MEAVTAADAGEMSLLPNQAAPKSDRRGLFVERKGSEVNCAIYGDTIPGSVRGVPGQVGAMCLGV